MSGLGKGKGARYGDTKAEADAEVPFTQIAVVVAKLDGLGRLWVR